jgi:glycosyltransferase involved in cell wall biosynthesis
LPPDETILLWGAGYKGNYRKGYHLVIEALEDIQSQRDDTPMLLTMGGKTGWDKPETLKKEKHLGYVRDPEVQALVYAASDVFLCTTLSDAQPQTALESLACGIPIICFDIGPMPELVNDAKTGFIAPNTTVDNLRDQILRFMETPDLRDKMRENCRNDALEKYNLANQTVKYIDLYQKAIADRKRKDNK